MYWIISFGAWFIALAIFIRFNYVANSKEKRIERENLRWLEINRRIREDDDNAPR